MSLINKVIRSWKLLSAVVFLGVLAFVLNSDRILFANSDERIVRYAQRIAGCLERDGVQALWSFDGPEVIEWTHGRREDNRSTYLIPGHFGTARYFNGEKGSRILTETCSDVLNGQYTISTWLKINRTASGVQHIIAGNEAFTKPIWLNNGRMIFEVSDRQLSYSFTNYNVFVNIVAVADGDQHKAYLYENGRLMAESSIGTPAGGKEYIVFGNYRQGNPANYALDETVIWNKPLSADEVKALFNSGTTYLRKIAGSKLFKIKCYSAVISLANAVLRTRSIFDPLSRGNKNPTAISEPVNLVISKSDMRYFNKRHNGYMERGCAFGGFEHEREITVQYKGCCVKANLSLIEPPAEFDTFVHGLPNSMLWRRSYKMVFPRSELFPGMKCITLYPAENSSYVLPVLVNNLREKCGWKKCPAGMLNLAINGRQEGVYYFEQADSPINVCRGLSKRDLLTAVGELPMSKTAILKSFDEIAKIYEPILANDAASPLCDRLVRYEIGMLRHEIMALDYGPGQDSTVERIKACLPQGAFLGSNLSPDFVMFDLDFKPLVIDDVRIEWRSLSPNLIDDHGHIIDRPVTNAYALANIEARLYEGRTSNLLSAKRYELSIVPAALQLPLVRIYVAPGNMRRNMVKLKCLMQYLGSESINLSSDYASGGMELKGNSTIKFPKKPYHIRTDDAFTYPGLYKANDFFLRASFKDRTLMHEKLSFELWEVMGKGKIHYRVPHEQYVELFVNDKYQGLYLFGESINRAFLKLPRYDKDADRNSVMYFAKHGNARYDRPLTQYYTQKNPHWKDMAGNSFGPLVDLLNFIGKSSHEKFAAEVSDLIDVDEIMDYQILLNFACNTDAVNCNQYIVRNNRKKDKFYVVPWDYESCSFIGPASRCLYNALMYRLSFDLPGYNEKMHKRWAELRSNELADENISKKIEKMEAEASYAQIRNERTWHLLGDKTYKEEVADLRNWILEHLHFLDGYLGGKTRI